MRRNGSNTIAWGRTALGVGMLLVGACTSPANPGTDARDVAADATTDTVLDGSDRCVRDEDCSDHTFCNGAERCMPNAAGADARGCLAAASPPCGPTANCNESASRCDAICSDADGDGHTSMMCGGDDCDDSDANRFPGNSERCDGVGHDEDCDPCTVNGVADGDADGDGMASLACSNAVSGSVPACDPMLVIVDAMSMRVTGVDCNDSNPNIHPNQAETCNSVDDNCDHMVDEGVLLTFTVDADRDGFGSNAPGAATQQGCTAPAGYAANATDCNDAQGSVHPGAFDMCDASGVDDDCNGTPNDPPGGCACTVPSSMPCPAPGVCASGTVTCIGGSWSMCSVMPTAETCNGLDDNCDGVIDNGVQITCYADADRDGFAASGASTSMACTCPAGTTNRAPMGAEIDCNDTTASVSPMATEICDGADQNCNGMIDEGLPTTTLYRDSDGDGHYGSAVTACTGTPGTSATNNDCDDRNRNVYSGQSAYFAQPYCRGSGWFPCFQSGAWGCFNVMSTLGSCARTMPSPPAPSWDYDCSGGGTPPASTNPTCGLTCSTYPSCTNGSGYNNGVQYTGTAPACGSEVATGGVLWSCGCGGSNNCITVRPSGYVPCR